MKPAIYFRADGGPKIGLGHIVRCIALAQMLVKDFKINFVCQEIPESSINELNRLGCGILHINDEEEFLKGLNDNAIVVLDHYGLDSNYQKIIKDKGCKLVCIDDLHDKIFFADLIINHTPNIASSDYKAQIYTQYALGPDYVLLRQLFLYYAKKQPAKLKPPETGLICFGGADNKELTSRALNIVLSHSELKKIIVITGPAFIPGESFVSLINSSNKIDYYHSANESKMVELIIESDFAIVPSSGILLEALAVGRKVISGKYVENQRLLFEKYKELGAFISAEDFSAENLQIALDTCLRQTNNSSYKPFDGQSDRRVLKLFKQLAWENNLFLRDLRVSDLEITYKWAIDGVIRAFSFIKTPIEFNEHEKWFFSKLEDQNCYYYMGYICIKAGDERPIGSIRFDIKGENAIISYLIDRDFHGKNLGIVLLKKGLTTFLLEKREDVRKIIGYVMVENKASCKVFEKLGFKRIEESGKYEYTILYR